MSNHSDRRGSDEPEQNPAYRPVGYCEDRLLDSIDNLDRGAREGWAEAAHLMRQRDEDRLIINPPGTRFDREEWDWC